MDRLSPERRSWNMGRIRGRDTAPERRVRSLLHRRGLRFALHRRDLPGRPDIVLPKWHAVIFVHGCFWHCHAACKDAVMPKTRPAFWQEKLQGNVLRDELNAARLRALGWRVLVVWECELRDERRLCDRLIGALETDAF